MMFSNFPSRMCIELSPHSPRALSFREQAPRDFIWREMSMHAPERVIPRIPRRYRPFGGYFSLSGLAFIRCRRAAEVPRSLLNVSKRIDTHCRSSPILLQPKQNRLKIRSLCLMPSHCLKPFLWLRSGFEACRLNRREKSTAKEP